MKWLGRLVLLLAGFSLLPLYSSAQDMDLDLDELILMLQLSNSSIEISQRFDESLGDLSSSQKNEDELLSDFEQVEESDSESLMDLEQNSNEEMMLTENLNLATDNLEETSSALKPSFWKSPFGTVLKWTVVVGVSFAAGYGTAELVDFISGFI